MKKTALAFIGAAIISIPQTASAEGLFDKIDRMVSDVESSISRTEQTINRAEGTASRLNNKAPQAGEETPAANPEITAEEQKILERARQIENDRTLEEANAIRRRSARRGAR